jgi:hypothetical protein
MQTPISYFTKIRPVVLDMKHGLPMNFVQTEQHTFLPFRSAGWSNALMWTDLPATGMLDDITNHQHNELGFPTSRLVTCAAETARESLISWSNLHASALQLKYNASHIDRTQTGESVLHWPLFNDFLVGMPFRLGVDHLPPSMLRKRWWTSDEGTYD